jgi:hypothetical protein
MDSVPASIRAGQPVVAPETVAPRSESELDRHIDLSPDVIASLAQGPSPPEHSKTTSYTAANTNAALREAFRILAGPEQLAILSNIVMTEAAVVAKQAVTPEALKATRISAQYAFLGTYDAAEQRYNAAIPGGALYMCIAGGSFAAAFLVGLFLAIWRFVIFGLR